MQVEAAEKRRQEQEHRGIKDPEKVRRMQERAAKLEQEEMEAAKRGMGNPALKVSVESNFVYPRLVLTIFCLHFSGKLIEHRSQRPAHLKRSLPAL